ncbi:CAP domain-containing protein [Peribacillus faecalis]|uniref:CAP domain-containing protein n=1 Tax=Peribacillus faecalis TaxID=2772559 RepID=UPI002E28864A|nr:CAP domain-containing protein [Peribacillus faecalis]
MKGLLKTLLLAIIFCIIGFYLFDNNQSSNESNNEPSFIADSQNNIYEIPDGGILSLIEKDVQEVSALFGEPDRIDLSAFGYEWWVYDRGEENYLQVAVQDQQVVSIYALGNELAIDPFEIGQRVNELYQTFHPQVVIDVEYDGTTYQFELSEEDLGMRPLIKIGDFYAQIYIDRFTGLVTSVRLLTPEVLVLQRPYEMIYRGDLPESNELSDEEWQLVDQGNEQQIFSITNIIRNRFEMNQVEWDEETAEVARLHSLDMFENGFFAHESPGNGSLSDRLESGEISFNGAGENIAAKYVDGVAAFEGWLNSKGHRDTLLNEDFTRLGVGVYQSYFTQNFIIQ